MKKSLHSALVVTAISSSLWTASALPVTPSSYTFTPGSMQGTYAYGDSTGRELIDGQFGGSKIATAADAVPFVGWLAPLVTINFEFDQLTTFNSVTVDALQAGLLNIVLPDVYLLTSVDGTTWTPVANLITPESTVNNNKRTALTLGNLSLTTEYLQIQLRRNDRGPWIFVDEVSFSGPDSALGIQGASPVPDATSSVALLGIGITALGAFRRMRS